MKNLRVAGDSEDWAKFSSSLIKQDMQIRYQENLDKKRDYQVH